MKMTKEKILLVAVVAVVAGAAALDSRYDEVPVPATSAPENVPPLPGLPAASARWAAAEKRSLLEPYSDLVAPDMLELPEPPSLEVPLADPPVRPYVHLDALRGLRHLYFDPAAAPPVVDDSDQGTMVEEEETEAEVPEEEAVEGPQPIALETLDWVKTLDGMGQTLYGRIDLAAADRDAGRKRYELLVDRTLDFSFEQVNPKDGKSFGITPKFRHRTEELGFADTLENNYHSRRVRLENAAGRRNLDHGVLRELASWCIEQASLPRYEPERRWGWNRAADCYREVLSRAPSDKETLKDLGRVLRRLLDLEGEVTLYRWWLARQEISEDPEVQAMLGEAMELLGLRDRARELYAKSLVTRPDGRVRLALAEILLSTGSLEDARLAVEAFRRAYQEGERTAGVTGEGKALLALGDLREARTALQKLAAESDRNADWYDAMGALLYCEGNLAEARDHFQAAVDKSPPASWTLAVSRTNLALAKARQANLMAEDDPARRTALESALADADQALRDDPLNYYWPHVARGYALRALGEPDKAVEALQEAVAAWPQEAYGRYLLGEFLLRDGRDAEARTQFVEAARLATGFPDALGGVGRAGGGSPGEARDFLRRAVEIEPGVSVWPMLAARAAMRDEGLPMKSRLEEARRDLQYVLERVDRNMPGAQAALGWVRYYQGDPDEALDRWNTAQILLKSQQPKSPRESVYLGGAKEWLATAIQEVHNWMYTRIWREEFSRPDNPALGNQWNVSQKSVRVTLKDKGVEFRGRMVAGEKAGIWKEWDAAKVLKTFVDVEVDPAENQQFDIKFWIPQGKSVAALFGVRKTLDGKAVFLVKPDHKVKDEGLRPVEGVTWPADGKVSFGLVKTDESKGTVSLWFNGAVVPGLEAIDSQNFMKTRGGKIRVEVEMDAPGGTEVRARVEAVEVWLDTK